MPPRRNVVSLAIVLSVAAMFFGLGIASGMLGSAHHAAESELRVQELRAEFARALTDIQNGQRPYGTAGGDGHEPALMQVGGGDERAAMIEEIKRQLQNEMGLLPLQLLKDRRESFVELYSYDNYGKSSYGTAGYLGDGYFITVKHGVVSLKKDDEPSRGEPRKIVSIRLIHKGKTLRARVIDSGRADVEVDPGDWAIIRVREEVDIPPLRVNTSFEYDFADPIFRLGNDYSKGIILSTGYVGQRTPNGLITCLTDGHPGVSGGGVLDRDGDLVGIPVGRMRGDYRFSFILPVRQEMFRKVPSVNHTPAPVEAGT
jgi:hypothetical protein